MSAVHFHIFWDYPKVSTYWLNVVIEIRSVIGSEIDFNFRGIYLGNVPTTPQKQDRYLLQILLAASKKAITKQWLSQESPTISEWIEIVQEIYVTEQIIFSPKHVSKKIVKNIGKTGYCTRCEMKHQIWYDGL